MLKKILKFIEDERGATAVEYGLMLALIAAGIIGAVTILGQTVNGSFSDPDLNSALGS